MGEVIFVPEKNNLVFSFSQGEDIISEISSLMKEKNEDYFEFLAANGNIEDFELLSSGQNASLNSMSFKDQFKLVSISGKIEKMNGKFIPVIYVSVSKNDVGAVNGQLVKAKAVDGLEITVRKVNVKKIILG